MLLPGGIIDDMTINRITNENTYSGDIDDDFKKKLKLVKVVLSVIKKTKQGSLKMTNDEIHNETQFCFRILEKLNPIDLGLILYLLLQFTDLDAFMETITDMAENKDGFNNKLYIYSAGLLKFMYGVKKICSVKCVLDDVRYLDDICMYRSELQRPISLDVKPRS